MSQIYFKRILPTLDVIVVGGLALIVDIVMVIALLTAQEWGVGGVVAALSCAIGFNGVALIIFLRRWLTEPDFITAQGTGVWTGGISAITKELMEEALDFYVDALIRLQAEESASMKLVSLALERNHLEDMLKGASIDWRNGPVTVLWPRIGTIKAYELQWGKTMLVQWLGSVSKSAFFHGLQHMVDEIILGEWPDYDHTDSSWWALVDKLNKEFGK